MVRQAPYAFGYVELIFAAHNKMTYGAVKNPAGSFVKATTDNVTGSRDGLGKEHTRRLPDLDYECSRASSYPHIKFHLDADSNGVEDANKAKAMPLFSTGCLITGETEVAAQNYAPLPKQVQDSVRKTVAQIR